MVSLIGGLFVCLAVGFFGVSRSVVKKKWHLGNSAGDDPRLIFAGLSPKEKEAGVVKSAPLIQKP